MGCRCEKGEVSGLMTKSQSFSGALSYTVTLTSVPQLLPSSQVMQEGSGGLELATAAPGPRPPPGCAKTLLTSFA